MAENANSLPLFFANFLVFLLHIFLRKCKFIAVLCNIAKNLFNEAHRLWVAEDLISVSLPMLKRLCSVVVLSKIGMRRGKLVANALNRVFVGHKRLDCAVWVSPVFDVMLVAPLVVKPGAAITCFAAANADRRAVALIKPHALEKLLG